MKTKRCALLVSALALPLSIGAVSADAVDPAKLPKIECSALKFSSEFLAKYPDARAACLEARDHNGKRYAKFND